MNAGGPLGDRHFYREQLSESVRRNEYPNRPSRLECGYAWIGEPQWEKDPTEYVYEVQYDLNDGFAADMRWLDQAGPRPLDELLIRARAYWSGAGEANELLVPGQLVVLEARE